MCFADRWDVYSRQVNKEPEWHPEWSHFLSIDIMPFVLSSMSWQVVSDVFFGEKRLHTIAVSIIF